MNLMTMESESQASRRQWLVVAGRWTVGGLLAAVGLSAGRLSTRPCINRSMCGGCPVNMACRLPACEAWRSALEEDVAGGGGTLDG